MNKYSEREYHERDPELVGADISPKGYTWKDASGAGAGPNEKVRAAANILKKDPAGSQVFNSIVQDGDNPSNVADSDLVGKKDPSSKVVDIRKDNQKVGEVDVAAKTFIPENVDKILEEMETAVWLIEEVIESASE